MVYLLLPGPGFPHCHFQHLREEWNVLTIHCSSDIFSVVPSTSWCSPCIWTRNSVLILRAASLSFSLLEPQRESISSMKMIDGLCSRAKVNRFFTSLERWTARQFHIFSLCYPHAKTPPLTFHFPPTTWTRGRRRRSRRRWSCWLPWPRPWPGRISLFLGGQTAESPATEFAFLHQHILRD